MRARFERGHRLLVAAVRAGRLLPHSGAPLPQARPLAVRGSGRVVGAALVSATAWRSSQLSADYAGRFWWRPPADTCTPPGTAVWYLFSFWGVWRSVF